MLSQFSTTIKKWQTRDINTVSDLDPDPDPGILLNPDPDPDQDFGMTKFQLGVFWIKNRHIRPQPRKAVCLPCTMSYLG